MAEELNNSDEQANSSDKNWKEMREKLIKEGFKANLIKLTRPKSN